MIETSQFQTLVAVAKFSSFSRAAEFLGVTQSAISQSIKNLEGKIGVRLFKRAGKKVLLTKEGEKLHALASNFLYNLDKTLDSIKYDQNEMSGHVRIGTLIGIGKSWLAPQMLALAEKYPDLVLELSLGQADALVRDFQNYKCDILVLPESDVPIFGERVLLGQENITLVFPKSKNFPIDKKITLDELVKYPMIGFEQDAPLFMSWSKKHFGEVPKSVNVRYAINSHGNMLQAVLKGLGIAVVPTHVLSRSIYKEKVQTLGKEFEVCNEKFYMVYHKDAEELMRIQKIIEVIKNAENPLGEMVE